MMPTFILWRGLVQTSFLCCLLLTIGSIVLWNLRQPADRLRVIQWVLFGCLIAPWLPGLSSWTSISLNLLETKQHGRLDDRGDGQFAPNSAGRRHAVVSESAPVAIATPQMKGESPETALTPSQFYIATNVTKMNLLDPPANLPDNNSKIGLDLSYLPSFFVLAYLATLGATIAWWVVGFWRRKLIEHSARPASADLQKLFLDMSQRNGPKIRLLVSDRLAGPITWGLFRPVIIVPSQFAESVETPQLRWSLAHELSHVERRDMRTLVLALLVQLICFYQPFYWWLRRQMSLSQDFLADARAAKETNSAEDYAEFLVCLARSRIQHRLPVALGIADGKSCLFRRVRFLLNSDGQIRSSCSRTTAIGSSIGTLLILALLSTIRLDADEATLLRKVIAPNSVQLAHQTTAFASNVPPVLPVRAHGGSIAGLVADQAGNPIIGAEILNHANNFNERSKTTTDANGAFILHDLSKSFGGYPVGVSASGFAPQMLQVSPGTAEEPSIVNVTLQPGHTVRGRIQLEGGAPSKEAIVFYRSPAIGLAEYKTCSVDNQGEFQFDSLPLDARFNVQMPGYAMLNNLEWEFDGVDPVTITLETPSVIRGRVINSQTRQPVQKFRVVVSFSHSRQPSDPQGTYESKWSHPGVSFESQNGEFVVTPLTNGFPVELMVEANGFDRAVIERAVAAKNNPAKAIDIELKPVDLSKPFTLSGQFLDHAGRPKPDVQLRLIVSNDLPTGINDNKFNWMLINSEQLSQKSYCNQFLSGTTNLEGRFEFKQILSGKTLQLAYWGQGVPQGKSLAFDETTPGGTDDVTIELPEPAKVRGTIDWSKYPEAESLQLNMNSQGGQSHKRPLEKNQSAFEFDDLSAGGYSLLLLAKPTSMRTKAGDVLLRSETLSWMTIRLKPGQTEEIRFEDFNMSQ